MIFYGELASLFRRHLAELRCNGTSSTNLAIVYLLDVMVYALRRFFNWRFVFTITIANVQWVQ